MMVGNKTSGDWGWTCSRHESSDDQVNAEVIAV